MAKNRKIPDYRKVFAMKKKYGEQLLKLNPKLNDNSGIYFWTRTDEDGINYFYIGQAKHILDRNISHMSGYQHIDLSIRSRGLFSESNPYGWKLNFLEYPESQLDDMEQFWILSYTKRGWQCRYNKTAGGQGTGKEKINEFKPSKGYRDGLVQGRKNLARELKHIIDKHLEITLKKDTKISQKALEKFWNLLKEGDNDW